MTEVAKFPPRVVDGKLVLSGEMALRERCVELSQESYSELPRIVTNKDLITRAEEFYKYITQGRV